MKKYLIVLCIMLSLALLASCGAKGLDVSGLEKSPYSAADQSRDVGMTLDDVSVSADTETLKLHFENSSECEYTFGMEPHLDVNVAGIWYVLPTVEDAVWIEIAYVLPPGESTDVEFSLKSFYGALPSGYYRIVKPLYSEAGDTFAIAEFTID